MKCRVCNSDLQEGQAFCSYCGAKIEADASAEEPSVPPEDLSDGIPSSDLPEHGTVTEDAMAKAGMILGIIALASNFTCCISGTVPSVLGIIFSVKGLKSSVNRNMAMAGLIMSCIAAAISLITPFFTIDFSGYDFEFPNIPDEFEIDMASMIPAFLNSYFLL